MAEVWETVAAVSELPDGGRISVLCDDVSVLVVRIGEQYFAIEDTCTHDGEPMTDGPIAEHAIECPRHGARFDLRTGRPVCMPATEPVRLFDVRLSGDDLQVRIS